MGCEMAIQRKKVVAAGEDEAKEAPAKEAEAAEPAEVVPVEEVPAADLEADLAAAPAAGSGGSGGVPADALAAGSGGIPADGLAVPMAAGDIPWTSELQNKVACFCANLILSKIQASHWRTALSSRASRPLFEIMS